MTNYAYPFGLDVSAFSEIPVDITTFIESDEFLGKYTKNGDLIYPFWKKILEYQSMTEFSRTCFATALGTGKTFISMVLSTYRIYQLLCLYDICSFFKNTANDNVYFVFASICANNADSLREMLYQMISDSPWFMAHGDFVNNEYVPKSNLRIKFVYKEEHCYGTDVVGLHFSWQCDRYGGKSSTSLWSELYARMMVHQPENSIFGCKAIVDMDVYARSKINKYWDHNIIMGSVWTVRPHGTFDTSKYFGIITKGIKGHNTIVEFDTNAWLCIPDPCKLYIVPYCFIESAKNDVDKFLIEICGIPLTEDDDEL